MTTSNLKNRVGFLLLSLMILLCMGSSFHSKIEELYYNFRIFERIGKWFLSVTGFFLLIVIGRFAFKKRFRKIFSILESIFPWATWIGFLAFTGGLGMRWILSGHAPLSNQYESMVLAAWTSLLAGIAMSRHSRIPLICGSLLAGIVLLMAHMPTIDASISPLPPVLKSKLMITHVSIAITGYGFFAVGSLLALFNLLVMAFPASHGENRLSGDVRRWSKITEQALWIGLFLITIGGILGSIWANESWGRYWGWDPKESWTLILILSYAVVLNLRFVIRSHWTYWLNVWALFAFGALLMTYFGVNRLFSGMHAYGGKREGHFPLMFFWIVGIWVVLSIMGYRNRKRSV